MQPKSQMITTFVTLVLVLVVFLNIRVSSSDTLTQITILEETDDYVFISAAGMEGRLFKQFEFDFEDDNIQNWFSAERWNQLSLLSPLAPTVDEYIAISDSIINTGTGFLDNNIAPNRGVARFEAVAPALDMVTSKSAISTSRMWFVEGDDLWFRARMLFETGVPYSVVDFEDNNVRGSPGIRVVIDGGRTFGIELKAGRKPRLRQNVAQVPIGQWVELVVRIELNSRKGQVQMWQDGVLILDDRMKTLPHSGSLLNSIQVGITASDMAAVMLVDDVALRNQPF